MVDIVVSSSYGYRLGAVSKWAMDVEDPLSTAIKDFPKRGILVIPFSFFLFERVFGLASKKTDSRFI